MFDAPEWTGIDAEHNDKPATHERKLVGVRFQPVGKVYHYDATGYEDLKAKSWVIVDTARGRQIGQVVTLSPPRDRGAGAGPFKRIERMATGRDMAMRHYYENKALEAMVACRAENTALGLPIKIVRAEYSFDGLALTFLYSTDKEERIETGDLRDHMSHLYQARIEMRQISPREVAKIIGGLGACGIETRCCSRFLTEFSPISIKHAKEQNLSLNPNDITGMCGRLRCCLVFEFEQYVAAKRTLPKVKSMIGTPQGEGKVVEVNPMRDTVIVQFKDAEGNKKEIEFHREQLVPLEELKRLQEKALSGTCDKHEGGGCDCGKGGKGGKGSKGDKSVEKDDTSTALPSAAQAFIAANEARQNEADARARAEAVRERMQKRREARDAKRRERRNHPNIGTVVGDGTSSVEAAGANAGVGAGSGNVESQTQPDQHQKRERERGRDRGRQRRQDQSQRQHRSQDQNRPQREDSVGGEAGKDRQGRQQQNPTNQSGQRRPLRKPLPKRKE